MQAVAEQINDVGIDLREQTVIRLYGVVSLRDYRRDLFASDILLTSLLQGKRRPIRAIHK